MTKRKPTYQQALALEKAQAASRAAARERRAAREAAAQYRATQPERDRCPDCGREKATNLAPEGYDVECPTFGYCAKRPA